MTVVVALIGAKALWLFLAWLASAIAASYLSGRKGYGERPGLASGLIVPVISVIVWLLWPARPESDWKVVGAFSRQRASDVEDAPSGRDRPDGPGPSAPVGT
jgi:hypothetical protein